MTIGRYYDVLTIEKNSNIKSIFAVQASEFYCYLILQGCTDIDKHKLKNQITLCGMG